MPALKWQRPPASEHGTGNDLLSCLLLATAAGRDPLRKLIQEAKAAGVDDRVHLPGRQPKEQMPAILAASDACLIHLHGCELFGTLVPSKIFEPMAMGRPILMGVDGEAREIVLEAGAGLEMEPDSPESPVQCLEKRTDHPTLADAMNRAGRAYVARYYNRDDLAARYLRLLERVVGVGKPAAEAVEGRGPKSEVGRRYPHLTPDTYHLPPVCLPIFDVMTEEQQRVVDGLTARCEASPRTAAG